MDDKFNSLFESYKTIGDKYSSMYIFVINNLQKDLCLEKITNMIIIIDAGTNSIKKQHRKAKLKTFYAYLDGLKLSHISGIFLIHNSVTEFILDKYWLKTLEEFQCDNFIVNYDDFYPIDWLRNLLLDRTYIHTLHLKHNNLKHYHLNTTKKKLFQEKDEKKIDLTDYVKTHVPKDEICFIHGISSFMKAFSETKTTKLCSGNMRDDQLLELHNTIINEQNIEKLQYWLDRLTSPKEGHKIVFGKEIKECVKNKMLKSLFCTTEIKQKLLEKVPKDDLIFDIIEIKNHDILKTSYDGMIGVKFY